MVSNEFPIIGGVYSLGSFLGREKSRFERVTDWYFEPKSFERSGKLYESLKIRLFKKLIMGSVGFAFKKAGKNDVPRTYFVGKQRTGDSLKTYELFARINEMIHVPLAVTMSYYCLEKISNDDYSGAIVSGFFAVLNAYCVMLQRYNRARVYNTLDKLIENESAGEL